MLKPTLFADRIEIHSPGGLGGPMRLENLLDKRWSRNATLVQGLAALDVIEELGFGLDRMVAVMADAGLPAPVFANTGDTFVVTLYGAGAHLLSAPHANTPSVRREEETTPLSQEERQAWILNHVRTVGPLSPRVYVTTLGIPRRTAIRDFQALEAVGLIDAQGTTKDRRYVLRHNEPE